MDRQTSISKYVPTYIRWSHISQAKAKQTCLFTVVVVVVEVVFRCCRGGLCCCLYSASAAFIDRHIPTYVNISICTDGRKYLALHFYTNIANTHARMRYSGFCDDDYVRFG